MAENKLIEGLDYYFDPDGRMVLTAHFLRNRGYCCGNGCRHCPYDYENVPAPKRAELLATRNAKTARPLDRES